MAKIIQIRNVPDDLHDALAAAARSEGISLSRFAQRELAGAVRRRRAIEQNMARIRRARLQSARSGRKPVPLDEITASIHEGRDRLE